MLQQYSTVLALDTSTESCSLALRAHGQIYERTLLAPQKHAELVLPLFQELIDEAAINKSELEAIYFGRGPGSFTGVRIGVSVAQALGLGLNLNIGGLSDLLALSTFDLLVPYKASTEAEASAAGDDASTGQGAGADNGTAGASKQQGVVYSLSSIDARMGEVYMALYKFRPEGKGRFAYESLIEECVLKPEIAIELVKTALSSEGSIGELTSLLRMQGSGVDILLKANLLNELYLERVVDEGKNAQDLYRYPQARGILLASQYLSPCIELCDPALAEPLYCRNEVTWKKLSEQGSTK